MAGDQVNTVLAVNLDQDMYPDLLTTNEQGDSVSVFINRGDGTFEDQIEYPVGFWPFYSSAADFDGDGDNDIAVVNRYGYTLSILLNNGDGTLQSHVEYAAGIEPINVTAADLNGDGYADLAATDYGSGDGEFPTVFVLWNNGSNGAGSLATSGSFGMPAAFPSGSHPASLAMSDLSGDGNVDLVCTPAPGDGNEIRVLLNDGVGAFWGDVQYETGSAPRSVHSSDLDGDLVPDVAVANYQSNTASILMNVGDGRLQYHVQYPVAARPRSISGGDLDADGDDDVVTANETGNSISVLRNRGDGTFLGQQVYSVGSAPSFIRLADLDNDLDSDVIVANSVDNTIGVLKNNGDGTFGNHSPYPTTAGPATVSLGDFDGDGDLDLIVTGLTGIIALHRNDGSGGFSDRVNYASGEQPTSSWSADFDGDSRPDIAFSDSAQNAVFVLRNAGGGALEPPLDFGVRGGPTAILAADLDRDLDLDIAVSNWQNGTISVLKSDAVPQGNTEDSPLIVRVFPDSQVVPRSEQLSYTAEVTNRTTSPQSFQFWTNVTLPSGNTYPPDRTLFGPITRTIPPSATRRARISHLMPGGAPLASFIYNVHIGPAFPTYYDISSFQFTVVNPPAGLITIDPVAPSSAIEGFDLPIVENILFLE